MVTLWTDFNEKMRSISTLLPSALIFIILTTVLLLTFSLLLPEHDTSIFPSRHGNLRASPFSNAIGNIHEVPESSRHHSNCSLVFEQGSAWVQWRKDGPDIAPDSPVCVIQKFEQERADECLENRLRERGKPFQAVFIGDSRARELFFHTSPRLGAHEELKRGKDNCLERVNRTYEAGEKRHGRDHWCSLARRGRLANTDYLVRHHLDKRYLGSVEELLSRCERGDCVDLLVVNGGLHEMWRNYGKHWAVGVQAFGRQLRQLAPLLAQLARRGVTVVWPLIEPPMEDAGGGFVRMTPEIAWLLNMVTATELSHLPGVHLWSSHIAVALWYQNLCRVLEFPSQMGYNCEDPLHPGSVAMENYFEILMNYMCDEYVAMPDSQCCGIRP